MTETLVVSVPDDELFHELHDVPGIELVEWDMKGEAPRDAIDIVVPPYMDGSRLLERLGNVRARLVQWQSIGFDGVTDHLPAGVSFANAASVHETSTAELAVALALAMQRGLPDVVRNTDRGKWAPEYRPALADQRVLLVGYGGIAKAIESRLAPFEVEITRLASRARTEQNTAGQDVAVHGVDELPELLGSADIVVISLPLNDSTQGLFDDAAFAAMPADALLINVGRGGVVDTDALVAALQAGKVRAGLDVVDPEPLPEGHPLWTCPNLLLTPHVGGDTTARLPRIVALVKRQIAHLLAGEEPENVVLEG